MISVSFSFSLLRDMSEFSDYISSSKSIQSDAVLMDIPYGINVLGRLLHYISLASPEAAKQKCPPQIGLE